jgi:hypothetical protein
MSRFHISQDETGFFQLSYENDAGELSLVSYQFDTPEQLIEDATDLAASGDFGEATVVIDPHRRQLARGLAAAAVGRPAPRKAGA